MKQLSIRYLDAEKHYVDDWAAYIEKKEMTEEEALEYLRDANSRTDRYAHIVDMDTFEARTADKRDDGEDTVDVYREFSLSDQRTRVQFIENMRRIFSGQSGVLGKYRIRETQTTVIGVGESVELKQADGTKKAYLLLRAIPVDSMKKNWIFPTEYASAEIGLITSGCDYVIQSPSMRSENFAEFIRSYNFADDYNGADVVFEQIAQTDSGLLSLKNSKGEDCYWYYSALDGFEGLDIVGVIPQSALYRQHNNWPIVWLICGTVLLLAVVDGIYILSINRRLRATDKGYIDVSVNADYPSDNYDGAILKFFEGDVPFWVCDTEKVSGMKKRESKSETFRADPFEYEFLYAPMADDGVCEFVEPWFGFAVSQNSDDYEYALEFLRFLAQEDQLNTLASVKGVPSATKNSSNARYEGIQNAENVAARYINDGTILNHVKNYFKQTASGLGNGDYATTEDAARDYVRRCAEVAAQMAENS